MEKILNGIEDCIGSTPIINLKHPLIPKGKNLYLKLEYFNPNFSIKDRTALGLVKSAIDKKTLHVGGTLIESTSGNLGKSLAMLGAIIGFKVILVMDPKVSSNVVNWCKAYGAEIIIVTTPDDKGGFQKARIEKVKDLLTNLYPTAFWPNQYENPDNKAFHSATTALEIADHKFDAIIGSASTGGHISGIAAKLKEIKYPAEIIACDVAGSKIFDTSFKPYLLNGVGLSWRCNNTDITVLDKTCIVTDQEAISLCHSLAKNSGVLIGGSGGLAVFTGLAWLHKNLGTSALCIIPDAGINYLEQFYCEKWLDQNNIKLLNKQEIKVSLQSKEIKALYN